MRVTGCALAGRQRHRVRRLRPEERSPYRRMDAVGNNSASTVAPLYGDEAATWGGYLRPNFHHVCLLALISSSVSGGGTGGRDSSVRKLPDSVSYGVTPSLRLISITIGIERGPSFR